MIIYVSSDLHSDIFIVLCDLSSPRSAWWRGGRVGDTSACSVPIHTHGQTHFRHFRNCNLETLRIYFVHKSPVACHVCPSPVADGMWAIFPSFELRV